MRSIATDVGDYLQVVPHKRRADLQRLRQQCLATLTVHDEGIIHGMPSYVRDGIVEVAFASHHSYISLYFPKAGVLDQFRDKLAQAQLKVRETCINVSDSRQLPFALIQALLDATYPGNIQHEEPESNEGTSVGQ